MLKKAMNSPFGVIKKNQILKNVKYLIKIKHLNSNLSEICFL